MKLRKKLKEARGGSVNRSQASTRSIPDKVGGGQIALGFFTSAEKDELPPKKSKSKKPMK